MGRHHRTRPSPPSASRAGAVAAAVGLGALAAPAVAAAAPAHPAPSTPCAPAVKACVSISKHAAWLTDGHGHVIDGAIPASTGGPGRDATPTGQFTVQWKDPNFRSSEYHGAPMPDSVFFDTHGRAFHAGNLDRASGGCVHLSDEDAAVFFDHLAPSDRVEIVR